MENTNSSTLTTLWNKVHELITNQEFGDDDAGDEEVLPMYDDLVDELKLLSYEGTPEMMSELPRLVLCASREYYFSEFASNAPGLRAGHRDSYKKFSELAKNVLRQIVGQPAKGVQEREEIVSFLKTLPVPTKEYGDEARAVRDSLKEKFGLKGDICESVVYAFVKMSSGMTHKSFDDTLNYAGLMLAKKRKAKK